MNGLLVIDKPGGLTSHDVVARMRRVLGEPKIGHTGTLDPAATGVLPLVVGRATRLARFLSASDKEYVAAIRLGVATDTYDAQGSPIGPRYDGELPARATIEAALAAFRGTMRQRPPAFSAKKIEGTRSYHLARRRARAGGGPPAAGDPSALPTPVTVAAHRLDVVRVEGDTVTIELTCSAGFYVRALAHDLGERLGIGAHLVSLRRTRSGDVTIDDAVAYAVAERDPEAARAALVPLARMLPRLAPLVLTEEGARRALHGRDLGAGDLDGGLPREEAAHWFRLVDCRGELVGLAERTEASGLLHPSVVLM